MSLDQKIVYAGLSRMTDDRAVIQDAYQYWQQNLSNVPFDVVNVTAKLVAYLGLKSSEKKVLMISMHAASNKSEVELDPVPGYLLGQAPAAAEQSNQQEAPVAQAADNSTPHLQITRGYIRQLVDEVTRVNGASYSEMHEILMDEGLPEVSAELNSRIKTYGFSDQVLVSTITEGECRELAHSLYMLMIDVIGPVSADIVINNIIDKLLQSSAATRFDPRSLI